MHIAEFPSGPFYRPKILSRAASGDAESELPPKIRDRLWQVLRLRAEMLMSLPDEERKAYRDRPRLEDLDEGDEPAKASSNTFGDDQWPPRWVSYEFTSPKGIGNDVYLLINEWRNQLKKQKEVSAEALKEINGIIDRYYFRSSICFRAQTRMSPNQHGIRVLGATSCEIESFVPNGVAQFASAAHNALIDIMIWLDHDLQERRRIREALVSMRERDMEITKEKVALHRERKKLERETSQAKRMLDKERREIKALRKEAEARMKEALALAELAKAALQSRHDPAPGPA